MDRGIDVKSRNTILLSLIYAIGIAVLLLSTYPFFLLGQEKIIAIKGGTIQTITKGVIENGVILIKDGRIAEVGSQIDIPSDAEVFDFHGKFIMPGVVSPDSNIGIRISEEDRMAAIQGSGAKNLANYPVIYSIYPEDPDYRLALMNGFTTLGISPPPEGISGLGAVINPSGEKLIDILVKDRAFLKINVAVNTPFFNMLKKALEDGQRKLDAQKKKKQEEKEKAQKGKAKEKGKVEEEKEEETTSETTKVFMEVLEGKFPILASCGAPSAISHLLELISGYPKVKLVIRGGPYTFRAGNLLKEKKIPVILEPRIYKILRWSLADSTNYVLKCQALGLKIAFQAPGAVQDQIHLFDFLNELYLHGVKKDVLLKGVTIIPAELLGVDKLTGSLEKGKRADMIVFKDDPIENVPVIEKVILGGKFVQ